MYPSDQHSGTVTRQPKQSEWSDISGANRSTYTVGRTDVGKNIRCKIIMGEASPSVSTTHTVYSESSFIKETKTSDSLTYNQLNCMKNISRELGDDNNNLETRLGFNIMEYDSDSSYKNKFLELYYRILSIEKGNFTAAQQSQE